MTGTREIAGFTIPHIDAANLPLGAIVAVAQLRYCQPMPDDGSIGWKFNDDEWSITDQERAFGDYTPGRYAWLLADVRCLAEPVPAKGALGLWEWEGELPL